VPPRFAIVAGVVAIVVVAVVALIVRGTVKIRRFERQVAEIAAMAGYAPFGPTEGQELTFRSPTSCLRVVRGGHGSYVAAFMATRRANSRWEDDWVDDDLLRQVLFNEEGDPKGYPRVWRAWRDEGAFLRFLRAHLTAMDAAMTRSDPVFLAAIASARSKREALWEDHLDGVRAEAARRRAAKGRK
jgi:hypothetical protein